MSSAGEDLIFLFSLPRSGSTLTQRIIASHPEVATAAEPWILLPFLYALREDGVYAEYGHRMMSWAVADFLGGLPSGRAAYLDSVRDLVCDLYRQARADRRYFLDKTPRYHLVVDEVLDLFPAARAVFLWRQPLAVAASVIDTFGDGRWNLDKFAVDLTDGLERLVAAYARRRERCLALRYEDLVADPEGVARQVFDYLGLDPAAVAPSTDFARVPVEGRMGDPGRELESAVRADPLARWRTTMANPLRRRWCRTYLRWIGAERLAMMGYDAAALEAELDALPLQLGSLPTDISRLVLGRGYWRIADRLSGVRRSTLIRARAHQSSGP